MENEYDAPIPAQEPYNYQLEKAPLAIGLGNLRTPPVRKIIEQQIKELEAQVAERKKFLTLLDGQPGVENILDQMRKFHI